MNNIYLDLCAETGLWPIYESGMIWEESQLTLPVLLQRKRDRIISAATELVMALGPESRDMLGVRVAVDRITVVRFDAPRSLDKSGESIATFDEVHYIPVSHYVAKQMKKENA